MLIRVETDDRRTGIGAVVETKLLVPELSREEIRYAAGGGNWLRIAEAGVILEEIFASASEWSDALKGVSRPWLCWSVDPDWCLVQQKLVQSVGWTPVVGYDPKNLTSEGCPCGDPECLYLRLVRAPEASDESGVGTSKVIDRGISRPSCKFHAGLRS